MTAAGAFDRVDAVMKVAARRDDGLELCRFCVTLRSFSNLIAFLSTPDNFSFRHCFWPQLCTAQIVGNLIGFVELEQGFLNRFET